MSWNYHWRSRPGVEQLEQTIDQQRADLVRLRRKLTSKEGYAAKLELVLKQRTQTIDDLVGKLEQSRAQVRRLDAENGNDEAVAGAMPVTTLSANEIPRIETAALCRHIIPHGKAVNTRPRASPSLFVI